MDKRSEILITSQPGLAEFMRHVRDLGRMAFDTEFVSEDTFEPDLCLIQAATSEKLAAIDPYAVKDLSPFWETVLDPAIDLVMHAPGEDLRICKIKTGGLPRRLFDIQLAAGLAGLSYPLSIGNLTNRVLGVSLSGGETRTDWRKRPLSPSQMRYALDDVRYLLEIADKLSDQLARVGRLSWYEDEITDFLEQIDRRSESERWRKLSGIHQLSRRGLEAARRLCRWREDTARALDKPLRFVLRDDLLVAVAKRFPTSRRDLEALRDFNRPHLISRAEEIVGVIKAAQGVAAEDLPEHSDRPEEGPGLSMIVGLLSATLARICAGEGISAGLVGGTGELKELLRYHLKESDAGEPEILRGWRGIVCGHTLLDVLAGRSALRVIDPRSEIPIEVVPLSSDRDRS